MWRLCPLSFSTIIATILLMMFAFGAEARSTCPKVLMFDGVGIDSQNNHAQAEYWGNKIGIQGFFLDNVMRDWQTNVGGDSGAPAWEEARQFQRTYSAEGVTDNFVKVAIYRKFDWSSAVNNAAIENFTNAASMARYAGLKGVALDLEPYQPIWTYGVSAIDGPLLQPIVYQEGYTIGTEMHQAYPSMTLVLIKDVLDPRVINQEKYGLATIFLKGLLSAGFAHVVIAGEQTYHDSDVAGIVAQIQDEYKKFMRDNGLPPTDR